MAPHFTLEVRETPQTIEIAPKGTLDESAVLAIPPPAGRTVVIDGSELRRLNSMGVAAWCRFVDELGQKAPVVMRRISPMMVTQASMISNFLGNARIESFLSPWICPDCDATAEQLHGLADPLPESLPCPKCKSAMELDWDRAAYNAFRAG